MANTYTQIYIHAVFTVQDRMALIRNEWKDELCRYIAGIVQKQQHKMIAINGMPDHLHVFVGMHPDQSVSSLLQDIKGSSSKWINERRFVRGKFSWQLGFGAFSCSRSHIDKVTSYIQRQELHHRKLSFKEEYLALLKVYEIKYDEKYLFKWFDQ